MMKIETHAGDRQLTLQVEGRLAGPFVPELEHCWHAASADRAAGTVLVDLKGVTCVDRAGRCLLQAMYRHGVKFVGARLAIQDVLDEVTASQGSRR